MNWLKYKGTRGNKCSVCGASPVYIGTMCKSCAGA